MKWSLVILLVGQSLDLSSTLYKFNQGCKEGNPVLNYVHINTEPRLIGLKSGLMISFPLILKKHNRLEVLTGLVGAAAGIYNMKVDCK